MIPLMLVKTSPTFGGTKVPPAAGNLKALNLSETFILFPAASTILKLTRVPFEK